MPTLFDQKAALRQTAKVRRAALTLAERDFASHQIGQRLLDWLATQQKRKIGVYLALRDEVDLDFLIGELLSRGFVVAAPRIENQTMNFWRLSSLEQVNRGVYGVREPISTELVQPEVVLVPGLAFDQNGGRLGMGGGWYDRVLPSIPVKVGVCFEEQMVENVPRENHDIKVDFLATPSGIMGIRE